MQSFTGKQMKAARALLSLSQQELADRAKVSVQTIMRIEKHSDGLPDLKLESFKKILFAFKELSVEFIGPEGGKTGVLVKDE